MDIKEFRKNTLALKEKNHIIEFLYKELGDYRDEKEDIRACLDYIDRSENSGVVFVALIDGDIAGVVVVNHTGMKKFIPENILVYIAVASKYRGRGIGGKILERVKLSVNGSIALHVEPTNPAKRLYERAGFTNKYLEMRCVN